MAVIVTTIIKTIVSYKNKIKQLCNNNYNEYYIDNFRVINYHIYKYNSNNAITNINNEKTIIIIKWLF